MILKQEDLRLVFRCDENQLVDAFLKFNGNPNDVLVIPILPPSIYAEKLRSVGDAFICAVMTRMSPENVEPKQVLCEVYRPPSPMSQEVEEQPERYIMSSPNKETAIARLLESLINTLQQEPEFSEDLRDFVHPMSNTT